MRLIRQCDAGASRAFFYFVNMLKEGVIIFNILLINLNKIGEGEDFCKYQ